MTRMPVLATERLIIRELLREDLPAVHQLLDQDLRDADFENAGAQALAERARWLEWTILSYEQLALLYQPPYGERAVTLKETGQLIGLVGFVPSLAPFEQLPAFAPAGTPSRRATPEVGLYYAVAPAHQRRGYAAEAARAMVHYAFQELHLKRVVATTTYDNAASQGIMRALGMRIERNPYPDPPWLQVVGLLDNQ